MVEGAHREGRELERHWAAVQMRRDDTVHDDVAQALFMLLVQHPNIHVRDAISELYKNFASHKFPIIYCRVFQTTDLENYRVRRWSWRAARKIDSVDGVGI